MKILGQEVFLTHNGREIKSKVESHDTENVKKDIFKNVSYLDWYMPRNKYEFMMIYDP